MPVPISIRFFVETNGSVFITTPKVFGEEHVEGLGDGDRASDDMVERERFGTGTAAAWQCTSRREVASRCRPLV